MKLQEVSFPACGNAKGVKVAEPVLSSHTSRLLWYYQCTHLVQCPAFTWDALMAFALQFLFHDSSFCSLLMTEAKVSFWIIKQNLFFHYFPNKVPIIWHVIQGPSLPAPNLPFIESLHLCSPQFEPNHFQNCPFLVLCLSLLCCVHFWNAVSLSPLKIIPVS